MYFLIGSATDLTIYGKGDTLEEAIAYAHSNSLYEDDLNGMLIIKGDFVGELKKGELEFIEYPKPKKKGKKK